MNLMDVHTHKWIEPMVGHLQAAAGTHIKIQLPNIVSNFSEDEARVGPLCARFKELLGASNGSSSPIDRVQVFVGTGDNGAAAMLSPSGITLSLGTSDTMSFFTNQFAPSVEGHVFASPDVDRGKYLSLACFSEGDLIRSHFRHLCQFASYEAAELILEKAPIPVIGMRQLDGKERFVRLSVADAPLGSHAEIQPWEKFIAVHQTRALIFLETAHKIGLTLDPQIPLLVVGGGSQSMACCRILSDVLGCPVARLRAGIEGTAVGAALLASKYAQHASTIDVRRFSEVIATPRDETHEIYAQLRKLASRDGLL
jgi:sugar (pentulose or hexulose) kinase